MGIDLTEQEFDVVNLRVTAAIINDGIQGVYASKSNKTLKGYWMQIVEGYEKYFTEDELNSAIEYVPLVEEEETYEI